MKKLIAGVILLGILSSCGNKKTNIDPFASITKEVDSVRQIADSSHHDKSPEDPQPIQADESFDDFIYNFASDDVLQRQRVKFPLPYYNGDKKSNIEERNWKHDDLFTKQHYYTLLFDREEDMDLVVDTSLTSVQVEWMFVKTRMVKRYYFERIKGAWILEAINLRPIEQSDNENFVEFFGHFATDSLCLLGLFCFTPSNLFWRRRWRRLVLCGSARKKKQKKGPQSPTNVHLKIKRKRCKKATTNTAGLAWGWVWLLAACTAHLWLLFFPCVRRNAQRATVTNVETRKGCGKKCVTPSHNNKQKKCKSETKQKDKKKGQTQRQKSFVQLECG